MSATLNDRLIAPGATRAESLLCYGTALTGAVVAAVLAAGLPLLAVCVITLVAFDLYGGAVVNATTSAKRWYHREGRRARHHLAFVAIHVQPFLMAWAVPGFTWGVAATVYGVTLAGAVIVVAAPAGLRRPAAFAVTALALAVLTTVVSVPQEVAWFAPLLLIKLLLAYLQPVTSAEASASS